MQFQICCTVNNMTYQQKINNKTNCRFHIENDDKKVGGGGVIQNGIIEFNVNLINRDSMDISFYPNSMFLKEKDWMTKIQDELKQWRESMDPDDLSHLFPSDVTLEIVEPTQLTTYRISIPNTRLKDNGNQWILRDYITFKIDFDNQTIYKETDKIKYLIQNEQTSLKSQFSEDDITVCLEALKSNNLNKNMDKNYQEIVKGLKTIDAWNNQIRSTKFT